jgi:hypothetical protein
MRNGGSTAVEALMVQLIANGPEDMGGVFAAPFEPAMRIERERFLCAGHYQRTPGRRGYANGTKPKQLDWGRRGGAYRRAVAKPPVPPGAMA